MATTIDGLDDSGNANEKEGSSNSDPQRGVEAMWEQMDKGIPKKALRRFSSHHSQPTKTSSSNNWMNYLQLRPPKVAGSSGPDRQTELKASTALDKLACSNNVKPVSDPHNLTVDKKFPQHTSENCISDEAKKLAVAALSAVKDAAAAAASNRGKIEITEVRDFAGQEIEIRKHIDVDSKEAAEKAKAPAPSAVDVVLEQIKKKQKLSVLDKTKKDWGEFKEENKGMEEELDAYKKSSNQYLDKISFLQRADYREFERERDARLALHARRRPDVRDVREDA